MGPDSLLLLASAGWAAALTQQCSGTAVKDGGNWYCGRVGRILYQGLNGRGGSYKDVTAMDSNGRCDFEDKPYSGPLAPLDEGLSIHFRGPCHIDEVAVYTPSRRRRPGAAAARRARAQRRAKRAPEKEPDMVTAVINGVTVSWRNNWFGPPAATTAPDPPPAVEAPPPSDAPAPVAQGPPRADETPEAPPTDALERYLRHAAFRPAPSPAEATRAREEPWASALSASDSSPASHTSSPSRPPSEYVPDTSNDVGAGEDWPAEEQGPDEESSSSNGDQWERIAQYNASGQVAENMVFMANYGGGRWPGVFDHSWGNSLTYLNADGTDGTDSPQILNDRGAVRR
ncbi:hypothetical protein CDD83_2245 [Cordyceps sp. RAO-2017]|nr:hypothetical protein CDD83_2245 [Cordyceps sp. RAO-2017]